MLQSEHSHLTLSSHPFSHWVPPRMPPRFSLPHWLNIKCECTITDLHKSGLENKGLAFWPQHNSCFVCNCIAIALHRNPPALCWISNVKEFSLVSERRTVDRQEYYGFQTWIFWGKSRLLWSSERAWRRRRRRETGRRRNNEYTCSAALPFNLDPVLRYRQIYIHSMHSTTFAVSTAAGRRRDQRVVSSIIASFCTVW